MQTSDKNTKPANIGVVLTDPDDGTANAFLTNIRKRGANAISITLSTLSASISASDFAIFDTDLKDLLALDAIIVRDVGISFALEQISFKFDLIRQFETANIPIIELAHSNPERSEQVLLLLPFQTGTALYPAHGSHFRFGWRVESNKRI